MISVPIKIYRLFLSLIFLISSSYAFGQDCSKLALSHRSSVVSLSVEKTKKETGVVANVSGTGFIVSPEGYVLTAYHVTAKGPDSDEVRIYGAIGGLDAQKSELRFVASNQSSDIALLKFRDSSRLYTPIPIGNPFNVPVGGQLCSLSFSAPLEFDYHATTGTLSSRTGQDERAGVTNLWTTQMPSNAGESGAPVLDLSRGKVVAIKYGGKPPGLVQNVNYVTPINMAKTLLEEYCNISIGDPEPDPDKGLGEPREPTLESVEVRFLTKDNGKDADTRLAMSIKKGGTTIASNDDIAHNKHFEHEKSYGPFSLNVRINVTKTNYRNSSITLTITPNGHDRWITSLIIYARFSDNQVIQSEFGPLIVDEDTRGANFQIP